MKRSCDFRLIVVYVLVGGNRFDLVCVFCDSGRTQKQLVQYVRDSGVKRTPYQR